MVGVEQVVGSWEQLCDRLQRQGSLARWSALELALSRLGSLADLKVSIAAADARVADELLGAVVRCGSAASGDDPDAALVAVHLLSPGLRVLVRRHASGSRWMTELMIGELFLRVRGFPPTRRRAYAANLLRDSLGVVLREVRVRNVELPADPDWFFDPSLYARPVQASDPLLELADLFRWAADSRVVTSADLELLWDLALEAGNGRGARLRTAQARAVSERTIRRHRDRALAALRAAVVSYEAAA